jgi:ABC-type transport system involved in cytochrome bd biosynthesis fused ATPase/permease subunit
MAAHLPFPIRPNEEGVRLVNFHDAVQYCVKQSRKNQRVATTLKVISAIGSTLILFLLGFWSADPQHQGRNTYIMVTGKVFALIVSVSASINYLFDFQRKDNKYDSARRVIAILDAEYRHAVVGKLADISYLDKMENWARKNFTQVENLLDNDKVYDVGMHFKAEPLPTP